MTYPPGPPPPALVQHMQSITLDVILRAVFGIEQGAQLADVRAKLKHMLAVGAEGPQLDPYAFRPERFLTRPAETYTWIPFGGGIRRCLGASFATFEMKTVLRAMLERTELRPASDRAEKVRRRAITLVPGEGTRVVLEHRRARPPAAVPQRERAHA